MEEALVYRASISPEDLKKRSVETEEKSLKIKFTEEELETMRVEFCKTHTDIRIEDVEFDSVKFTHKKKIEELETKASGLLEKIETGYEFNIVKCYLIPNFDMGVMEYYNEHGEFVLERDLLPEERQLKMELKEANNQINPGDKDID